MTEKTFGIEEAETLLREQFAPWVQDLNMTFEEVADGAVLVRVPMSENLSRSGNIICGQAMMAVADTAMVFAISSALGEFKPMTTVSQSTSFLRPAAEKDLMARASLIKLGRSLVYGEVNLYSDKPEKSVAHVTSTYMLL